MVVFCGLPDPPSVLMYNGIHEVYSLTEPIYATLLVVSTHILSLQLGLVSPAISN